jgi:tetratricopeptide (TPR) repeat protein
MPITPKTGSLFHAETQAARKPPESLDAWDCYQRGLWNLWRFTTPGFDSAEEYFQRSIAADPTFARGHGALSYVNIQRSLYDAPEARGARLKTALHQARTAVSLDELDCFCHCALGRALCLTRQNEEASAAIGLSLELNPSFAQGYFAQGFNLLWCGREIEAETLLDQATILGPRDSHLWSFHHTRSWAHFSLGKYDIAAEFARRATRQANATYRAFAWTPWGRRAGKRRCGRTDGAQNRLHDRNRRTRALLL